MGNLELDDKIDRFILGQMNETEFLEFTDLVGSHDELQDKIEQRKLTLHALRLIANDEIKKKLIDHEAEHYAKPKRRIIYNSIAATIALLVVLSVSWYFNKSNDYLSSFDFYEEGISNVMGNNANIRFHDGMNAFKMDDYTKCIDVYSSIPKTDTTCYYMGVSYYRTSDFQKALGQFNNVLKINSTYKENAEFRKVLTLLQLERKEEAMVMIRRLKSKRKSRSHSFSKQIEKLESHLRMK